MKTKSFWQNKGYRSLPKLVFRLWKSFQQFIKFSLLNSLSNKLKLLKSILTTKSYIERRTLANVISISIKLMHRASVARKRGIDGGSYHASSELR